MKALLIIFWVFISISIIQIGCYEHNFRKTVTLGTESQTYLGIIKDFFQNMKLFVVCYKYRWVWEISLS